jgi:hypothetical protein
MGLNTAERHAIEAILDRPTADPDDDAVIAARAALRLNGWAGSLQGDLSEALETLHQAGHFPMKNGYCSRCGGQCIVPAAKANSEIIRQAAYAKPDPFSPQWEACKVCGGDHWTRDHEAAEPHVLVPVEIGGMTYQADRHTEAGLRDVARDAQPCAFPEVCPNPDCEGHPTARDRLLAVVESWALDDTCLRNRVDEFIADVLAAR